MKRQDGLTPGSPFFVVQLFNHEGYFCSCLALSPEAALAKAITRAPSARAVAFSFPFLGKWCGNMPDITLPDDFRSALETANTARDDT